MLQLTFISYDGSYPNLCSGQLILAIDGIPVTFPPHCLVSGGTVYFDHDWTEHVEQGEWDISNFPEDFPDELKVVAVQLVNEHVEQGCCGGCV